MLGQHHGIYIYCYELGRVLSAWVPKCVVVKYRFHVATKWCFLKRTTLNTAWN